MLALFNNVKVNFASKVSINFKSQTLVIQFFYTGASVSLSPNKDDFINFTPIVPSKRTISGISTSPEQVLGTGTMKCIVYTDTGYRCEILTEALYVPTAQLRILSVCQYQEEHSTLEKVKEDIQRMRSPKSM
ncbi:hypothetical protein CTEN210_07043 [Chaetoceros tenuissimus]|uniref:Retrovirus-related Pol polyprotein from transposon TNT 1-94-like beta-barrel domain-containing protein n=1 Tax=Chaetoceros tenuissimus TaxID=426638 RepID=A0AAD3H4R7_9STRA|nr:hypothetical protein CTEN210_07043 [Chaetoceros tenuissimus]